MSEDINVGAISEALNNKVDLNQLNANVQGLEYGSGWGIPSGKFVDLTLGASGANYTAPANGWALFGKVSGSATAYIELRTYTPTISCLNARANNTTGTLFVMIPVIKGQIFTANYNATGATDIFRFVYAEGAKGEQ